MATEFKIAGEATNATTGSNANEPTNQNFLSPVGFRFGIRKRW